jgi:hypothetical protein
MEPQKIVEFLDQYPVWFKLAFVIFFALFVLGFLTLRQPRPAVTSAPAGSSAAAEGPSAAPDELTEYFKTRRSLEGRFLELEEFDKALEDKPVSWLGYVSSVSSLGLSREHSIQIIISTRPDYRGDLASVRVSEDKKARAYSLRKGDLVKFSGVANFGGCTPSMSATKIELHKSAGAT